MTTIRTPEDEPDRPGWFYPPFREGWTYQGATYGGHSDFAVDWNRRTPGGGWLQDEGDPVLASADGTVAEVDTGDGLVMLNHHAGLWRTEHRHMKDILVKVGDKVERGQRIGSIGNVRGDGRSTGPHLHHVHWKRDTVRSAWRRTAMRFMGLAVGPSVSDSDSRPKTWKPPAAEMIVGPLPKATWEGAFKEAAEALDKAVARLDAQKAQTALATEERDTARRGSQQAEEARVAVTLSVSDVVSERDIARRSLATALDDLTDTQGREQDLAARLDACTTSRDCSASVKAAVRVTVETLVGNVKDEGDALLAAL